MITFDWWAAADLITSLLKHNDSDMVCQQTLIDVCLNVKRLACVLYSYSSQ